MRIFTIAALSLALAACAGPNAHNGGQRAPIFSVNPSGVLALDIAQSRRAKEDGAWAALKKDADDDAILFIPEPVNAKKYLSEMGKGPQNVKWQPHQIFMSCDGRSAVTTGAIQWGEKHGYYSTIWQYKERSPGNGQWYWTLTHSAPLDTPRPAPELLQTKIAKCAEKPPVMINAPAEGVEMKQGLSRDQTLSWIWQFNPDKSHILIANIWNGESWENILMDNIRADKK
ncbi:hypothetical protein LPB140_02240 [Sphingorhabdus lutea]|uniref:Uncharacterized protein n=1 Tax=Sphingorhabdus lutea TaxID=1913578 RepID=A0A1L3J9P9_9SPHN|nr:hypothetical protein [Sphingorhabdus lutea]APG61841.1 hypothetical protein LPB140_02240 [Sphingorhabdus lutea]